jgi:hypothetical protein
MFQTARDGSFLGRTSLIDNIIYRDFLHSKQWQHQKHSRILPQ